MSWKDLEEANPEMAAFGLQRLNGQVAYLATVRKDGSPRVHPVTPIIGGGHLFLFMEPSSPKGFDLRRDGRFALHCAIGDSSGGGGEFFLSGRASFVEQPEMRAAATQAASYTPADRYILFELNLDSALATVYEEGQPVRQRWQKG